MTREEAIIDLNALKFILDNDQYRDEIEEALNTAISALKQMEKTQLSKEAATSDCISRQGLRESLLSENYGVHDYCFPCKEIMKRIDAQSSTQPEHLREVTKKVDVISRQAALDELCKAGCGSGYCGISCEEYMAIENLPSAQPDYNKQRLINSIRAGIVATNTKDVYSCGMRNGMRWCKSLLEDKCPTFEDSSQYAQPEQRWIPVTERLPKPYEYCLWTTTDGRVIYHHCDGLFSNYTAWMPLPEPYQEGEQDERDS